MLRIGNWALFLAYGHAVTACHGPSMGAATQGNSLSSQGIGSTATAAPEPSQAPRTSTFRCSVKSEGKAAYLGPCRVTADGTSESFTIEPIGVATLAGANPLTVSVLSPGTAEVRGLTRDGINSRWGEAKRSARDRECWVGDDFEICVRAGDR